MIRIADIRIKCTPKYIRSSKRLSCFKTYGLSQESQVAIRWQEKISKLSDDTLKVRDSWDWDGLKEAVEWHDLGDYHRVIFLKADTPAGSLDIQKDFKKARIEYNNQFDCSSYSIPEAMMSFLFRNLILHHQGIVLHASALQYKGKAILFTAASGTGKSTHTSLWETCRQAMVFNDDSPAIRITQKGIFAYGTPWSGTSEKYLNVKVPLHSIVVLERGSTNRIERLEPLASVAHLLPRLQLPYQNENEMHLALNHVDRILSEIPIFKLACTPDLRAVETVETVLNL